MEKLIYSPEQSTGNNLLGLPSQMDGVGDVGDDSNT